MLQSERCDTEELTTQGFWFKTCYAIHKPSSHDIPHMTNLQVCKDGVLHLHVKLFAIMKRNQELLYINKKWAEQYNILKQLSECKIKQMKKRLEHCEQKKEEEVRLVDSVSAIDEDNEQSMMIKQMKKRLEHCEQKKEEEVRLVDSVSAIDEDNEQSMMENKLKTETGTEMQFLRVQCDTLTKKVKQQEEEIKRLNEALLVLKSSESQQNIKKTEEDIWRHQAEVYKEDFLKERRDRNKLKEKYIMLENRLKKIH